MSSIFDYDKAAEKLQRFGVDINGTGVEQWVRERGNVTVNSFVESVLHLPWGAHIQPENAAASMYRYESRQNIAGLPNERKNQYLARLLAGMSILDPYSASVIAMNAEGIMDNMTTAEEIRRQHLCQYFPDLHISKESKALIHLQEGLKTEFGTALRLQGHDFKFETDLLDACIRVRPLLPEHPWAGLKSRFGIDFVSLRAEDGHRVLHPVKYDVLIEKKGGNPENSISESRAYMLAVLYLLGKGRGWDVSDGIICRRIIDSSSKVDTFMEMTLLQVSECDLQALSEKIVTACDRFWVNNLIHNQPMPALEPPRPAPFNEEQAAEYIRLTREYGRAVAIQEEAEEFSEMSRTRMMKFLNETIGTGSIKGMKFPGGTPTTILERRSYIPERIARCIETIPGLGETCVVPTGSLDLEKVQNFLNSPDTQALLEQQGITPEWFQAKSVNTALLENYLKEHPDLGISPESLVAKNRYLARSRTKDGVKCMGEIKDQVQGEDFVRRFVVEEINAKSTASPTPENFF